MLPFSITSGSPHVYIYRSKAGKSGNKTTVMVCLSTWKFWLYYLLIPNLNFYSLPKLGAEKFVLLFMWELYPTIHNYTLFMWELYPTIHNYTCINKRSFCLALQFLMCNKVHRRHTGITLGMITSFKSITDLTHRVLLCVTAICVASYPGSWWAPIESRGTRLQFVILWCTPSFQVTLCGGPGASPLSPLPPHWYQSSLHWNRRCTFSIPLEVKWYWC